MSSTKDVFDAIREMKEKQANPDLSNEEIKNNIGQKFIILYLKIMTGAIFAGGGEGGGNTIHTTTTTTTTTIIIMLILISKVNLLLVILQQN